MQSFEVDVAIAIPDTWDSLFLAHNYVIIVGCYVCMLINLDSNSPAVSESSSVPHLISFQLCHYQGAPDHRISGFAL